MKVNTIDSGRIEAMLAQLRSAAQKPAQALNDSSALQGLGLNPLAGAQGAEATPRVSFADALKSSLNAVNQSQLQAESLGKSFSMGDDSVSLSDVMISGQKASINFQATLQVRNKMVSAYQEIMNMQV